MPPEIALYNQNQLVGDQAICDLLAQVISTELSDAVGKVWHAHPVWFLEANPIVGYSKQKRGIRLMFWSGAGFNEDKLNVRGEKFMDASVFYQDVSEIDIGELIGWLRKSREIQWDYKNLIKRKGKLERLR